jgi:Tol biopolymer transport system component
LGFPQVEQFSKRFALPRYTAPKRECSTMKNAIAPLLILTACLSGCMGSARLTNMPFDPGGRSVNSPAAEMNPKTTGQYLVFVSDRQRRQDIYLYDLQNRRLIETPGLNSLDTIAAHPDVSNDGRYIVVAGSRQGQSDIYLYDRDTRQLRNLTANLQAEVRNPTLSADGKTIAFESSVNGQWDILVYSRSGEPLDLPVNPR